MDRDNNPDIYADVPVFDRYTHILVEAEVEMMFHCGKVETFTISDILCFWLWDEMSRDAAEYWAVWDHVGANYTFDWMSIKSWSGSPVKLSIEPRSKLH